MALPADKIVTLEVNREGILRQAQRARNKLATAKTLTAAPARNAMLNEADKELADAMAELKAAPAPTSGPSGAPSGPSGTPTGPSGATGPTGAPSGPSEAPFRILSLVADWKGLHWPSRLGAIAEMMYEGRRAIHMSVLPADGSPGVGTSLGTTRAQLETESFIKEAEEVWTRGRFFLPSSFSAGSGWGVNIVEPYFEKGDGSPPWQLQARGLNLECRSLGGSLLFGSVPLTGLKGRWVTYAIGRKNLKDGTGWLELHIDDLSGDHPVVPRHPLPMGSFSGAERFIIQCYYQLSQGAKDLFYENEVVFGRSLASVR